MKYIALTRMGRIKTPKDIGLTAVVLPETILMFPDDTIPKQMDL